MRKQALPGQAGDGEVTDRVPVTGHQRLGRVDAHWPVAGLALLHLSVPTAQRRELHGHLIPCSSASGDQMADALSSAAFGPAMASKSPSAC